MLATASFDASTAVWTERGGDWECVAVVEGHENEVKSCAFSPSGSLLATCGRDKTVWIWECQPGFDFECVAVLHGHTQDVKQVKWHPTEDVLVSVSYDNDVRVWEEDPDGDDWSCARVVSEKEGGHGSTVWSAAFETRARGNHATGDLRMATCSDDRNIVVWDAKGADRERRFTFFAFFVGEASSRFSVFRFSSRRDVSRATNKTFWALVRRSSRARSRCARVNIPASEIEPWAWQLQQAKLQPRRHLLVDVSDLRRRHRRLFCSRSARLVLGEGGLFSLLAHLGSPFSSLPSDARVPSFENKKKRAETAGSTGLALAATATFSCGHDRPTLSLSWGAAGLLAAGGGDNSVRCYGAGGAEKTWREVGAAAKAHADDVNCVAWHPTNPNMLASCADDGSVKIWNVAVIEDGTRPA
jgi:WD40 repeat protein